MISVYGRLSREVGCLLRGAYLAFSILVLLRDGWKLPTTTTTEHSVKRTFVHAERFQRFLRRKRIASVVPCDSWVDGVPDHVSHLTESGNCFAVRHHLPRFTYFVHDLLNKRIRSCPRLFLHSLCHHLQHIINHVWLLFVRKQ